MLRIGNLTGFGAGGIIGLAYRNHTYTEASNTDPTIPSGIVAGDLLLACAIDDGSGPVSTPSGWTSIAELDAFFDPSYNFVVKVSDGTETGSLQMFAGANQTDVGAVLALSGGVVSLGSILDIDGESTSGNPSAQVKNTTVFGTLPFIVVAAYQSTSAVDPRTWTGDDFDDERGGSRVYIKWKFYGVGSSPSDITVDMDDEGAGNVLMSAIIEVNF